MKLEVATDLNNQIWIFNAEDIQVETHGVKEIVSSNCFPKA